MFYIQGIAPKSWANVRRSPLRPIDCAAAQSKGGDYGVVLTSCNFVVNNLCQTLMILSFLTDWSVRIVQTQIRLLLEKQSDQGLQYLQYCLHLLDALLYSKSSFSEF